MILNPEDMKLLLASKPSCTNTSNFPILQVLKRCSCKTAPPSPQDNSTANPLVLHELLLYSVLELLQMLLSIIFKESVGPGLSTDNLKRLLEVMLNSRTVGWIRMIHSGPSREIGAYVDRGISSRAVHPL